MAKVMDLIKRFYSTFIRYFLIKLVFLYVYKWIQRRSTAVYICKEEYLILLILLNWRRLLAQIFTIGSFLQTRPGMCVFIGLVMEVIPLVASTKSVKCPFRRFKNRFWSSHQWFIMIFETKRNPNCHFIANSNAHLNHALSFLFFPPFHISVFCPVCSFWC